ncbi:MAG: HNH endonuclease [Thiogranum sp.]|nr:HNH endonuclease [Thiogranum sp.]
MKVVVNAVLYALLLPDPLDILLKGKKMPARNTWTRNQLLIAFKLYCEIPFGKMHSRNPEIIKYAALIGRTPSALAMKLTNMASLDPAITSTGRKGLRAASVADKAMWDQMQSDWEQFALEVQGIEEGLGIQAKEEIHREGPFDADERDDHSGESRSVLTAARIGQEFFRRSVLSAYNYRCCVTGLAVPELLIASHIVPWAKDPSNRLNPRNGLCLSMLHDKAFDMGIMTLDENMTIHVSRLYAKDTDEFFRAAVYAFEGQRIALPEKFIPRADFLDYHRKVIFEARRVCEYSI